MKLAGLAFMVLLNSHCGKEFFKSFQRRKSIERSLRPDLKSPRANATDEADELPKFDHGHYQKVLDKALSKNGSIDYNGLRKGQQSLRKYLEILAQCRPQAYAQYEWDALVINAFNAYILQLIMERSGSGANTDFRDDPVWSEDRFNFGGVTTNLYEIQQMLFDTSPDSRVKLALIYGTRSSHFLRKDVYSGSKLARQLKEQQAKFNPDIPKPEDPFKNFEQGMPVKPD